MLRPKPPKKGTKHNHEKIPKGLDLKLSSGCILKTRNWHQGPKKDSWFSHVALEVPGEGCSNEWCERVSDEEYAKLEG